MAKISINKVSEAPEKEYIKAARKVVFGTKRPPLFTRVLIMIAFTAFIYYFFWNGLRLVALTSIDSIENPQEFKASIQSLGEKFDISDGLKTFKQYALGMMFVWALAGVGLSIIYRRKIIGYYLFFAGMLGALAVPLIVLGFSYSFEGGADWIDFVIPPILIAVFYLSFKRLKKLKEEAAREALL